MPVPFSMKSAEVKKSELMTVSELQGVLRRLRYDADNALMELDHATLPNEPYNAADLSCTSTSWGLTENGEDFWSIVIEEAAPDCNGLQRWLRDKLEPTWGQVVVITEW